ncbi:glutamine synthetase family protein [Muricomes sp. OA1]|uniref:Glutamine synthetase n=1 Tax=Hungatella hathewayi TaxID=154046 RepID=A0A3E2WS71_9FIRM|nr:MULTISPECIES: glutamine synthetase family protein [Clostridia]MCH1972730.1 glutamine synthetase family protein [Muricomes sp. OA1]RGC29534.1 glutamine synthetase [Hungatella hathewayi]GKH31492.1 glutamine synthetase [Faecalicatena contorta]
MNDYTREDILEMVEEEDVGFIRLQFTDIYGTMKNMAVTVSQLEKVLNNECMFDGSSIEGFSRTEESDMYLYPDLNTFEIFPWRPQQGKVARFICDVHRPDGTPYESDPRCVLKKVIREAREMGYTMNAGPECEFFLFHTDDDGLPTTITHERGSYFDVGPLDYGENARRDMVLTLEEMGFEIETSHHEIAPAQHEIDFRYDEALATADNIMTFKLVVKTIAKRHGLHATFMPKPKSETYGSGMHLNLSLSKDGTNIFQDSSDKNGLSREGYYFMGGLLKHMKAITCITNPTVNSYKRFVPGYEAPVYMSWSARTRGPLIRIPSVRGEKTRIELRSPDPSANPYLALAVLLAAGLDGIKNQILPPDSVDEDIQAMSEEQRRELHIEALPWNLMEAVRELEGDALIREVLGADLTAKTIASHKKEYHDYCMQVTDWELANYLHKM